MPKAPSGPPLEVIRASATGTLIAEPAREPPGERRDGRDVAQPQPDANDHPVGQVQNEEALAREAGQKDHELVQDAPGDADGTRAKPPHQQPAPKSGDGEHEARQKESDVDFGDAGPVEIRERSPKDAPGVEGAEPGLHDHRGPGDDPPAQGYDALKVSGRKKLVGGLPDPARPYDHCVRGLPCSSPSTSRSTFSLKKHRSPFILGASGMGSG